MHTNLHRTDKNWKSTLKLVLVVQYHISWSSSPDAFFISLLSTNKSWCSEPNNFWPPQHSKDRNSLKKTQILFSNALIDLVLIHQLKQNRPEVQDESVAQGKIDRLAQWQIQLNGWIMHWFWPSNGNFQMKKFVPNTE